MTGNSLFVCHRSAVVPGDPADPGLALVERLRRIGSCRCVFLGLVFLRFRSDYDGCAFLVLLRFLDIHARILEDQLSVIPFPFYLLYGAFAVELCLAAAEDGTVYIGTEGGLNYTKADGSIGSFKCDAVKTAFAAKNGKVYIASGKTLYCAADGKIEELQAFDSEILDMSGINDTYLLAENALYKLNGEKFERFFHNGANAISAASKGEGSK